MDNIFVVVEKLRVITKYATFISRSLDNELPLFRYVHILETTLAFRLKCKSIRSTRLH